MLKITPVWILITSLRITGPALAVDLHQEPLVSVSPGEAATLHCTFGEHMSRERLVWYKYKLGQTLRQVGSVMGQVLTQPEFEKLGIKLEANRSSFSLTIPWTTKDDEGMYFCGKSQGSLLEFTNGTFLAVRVSHQRDSGVENPTRQDSAAVELLYAAKSLRMKSGRSGHGVYSEVRYFTLTDVHQSH
ncbi:hypothetical protein NFI96_009379 [Prochilodus magdalenae]|nr:hypothetical protein NFI96_009379 [Prochilodus magdalenae]